MSKVISTCTFVPNKQFGQLINISPQSLKMMNTINTEFSSIEVWFTHQVSEALEIGIIKMRYSTEPKFRKYVKGYDSLLFARKFGDKYGKKLMDTATKKRMDAAKTASKRVVQKIAEATGDLTRNKIADKITSIGKPREKEKTKKIEEIYIPREKNTTNYI